jgi:hypothetical protein
LPQPTNDTEVVAFEAKKPEKKAAEKKIRKK